MGRIILFAGTSEGRRLAQLLTKYGKDVLVCVATEYGEEVLKDVPPEAFRKALHAIVAMTPTPYYEDISDDPKIYDGELSCAVMKNDTVSSLLLFEKLSDMDYQLVIMSSLSEKPAIELKDLITYSAAVYYLKLPEDAGIHVRLATERSMSLFSYFFPDKELALLRRGYFE